MQSEVPSLLNGSILALLVIARWKMEQEKNPTLFA